jgi:hypothetical protein
MVSDGDEPVGVESTVDGDRLSRPGSGAEVPDVVAPEAAGPDAEEPVSGAPARRPLVGLGVVALVLAIAVAVVGVLFVRERSAHDDDRRALRAEVARAAQFERDLAAARAERAEFEKKVAAAEAQVLSAEAKTAIANCVKAYALVERVMADAQRDGAASGSVQFMVPVTPEGGSAGKVCTAAEQYLGKIS